MQITPIELYWITRFDSIHNMLTAILSIAGAFGVASFIVFVMFSCMYTIDGEEDKSIIHTIRLSRKFFFGFLLVFFAFLLVKTFVPTTKEAAMLKVVPALVNCDFVQKDIPDDLKQIYTLGKDAAVKYLKGEEK